MSGAAGIQRLFWLHVLVATGSLAAAFSLAGEWPAAVLFLLILGLWLAAQVRGARAVGSGFLFILALGSAAALWLRAPGWLPLLAVVAALGAWDLDHYLRRLNAVKRVAFETGLARAHLLRLALVEAAGFLAGWAALTVQLRLPFWWEVLLVIIALAGIGRLITYTRSQAED
jgi:hypothetical protein